MSEILCTIESELHSIGRVAPAGNHDGISIHAEDIEVRTLSMRSNQILALVRAIGSKIRITIEKLP